jgi:hypothetical protein
MSRVVLRSYNIRSIDRACSDSIREKNRDCLDSASHGRIAGLVIRIHYLQPIDPYYLSLC